MTAFLTTPEIAGTLFAAAAIGIFVIIALKNPSP
jgi:hypothetical protein